MARQRKIEINEDDIGTQPVDTNSTALQPNFMRENVGHTLSSTMTGRMEPLQNVMHHGPADTESVVAGVCNSEMSDENIRP